MSRQEVPGSLRKRKKIAESSVTRSGVFGTGLSGQSPLKWVSEPEHFPHERETSSTQPPAIRTKVSAESGKHPINDEMESQIRQPSRENYDANHKVRF